MALSETEYKSQCQITNHTSYLALTGELWGVFCENLGEYWPCYNSTALYGHHKSDRACYPWLWIPVNAAVWYCISSFCHFLHQSHLCTSSWFLVQNMYNICVPSPLCLHPAMQLSTTQGIELARLHTARKLPSKHQDNGLKLQRTQKEIVSENAAEHFCYSMIIA